MTQFVSRMIEFESTWLARTLYVTFVVARVTTAKYQSPPESTAGVPEGNRRMNSFSNPLLVLRSV